MRIIWASLRKRWVTLSLGRIVGFFSYISAATSWLVPRLRRPSVPTMLPLSKAPAGLIEGFLEKLVGKP